MMPAMTASVVPRTPRSRAADFTRLSRPAISRMRATAAPASASQAPKPIARSPVNPYRSGVTPRPAVS